MINETGLTDSILVSLKTIFSKYSEVKQIKLYGSRAKGTFHSRSDIDLVVFGEGISRFLISSILLDLDDSDIPYSIDLQYYDDIKNDKLRSHIDRVGIFL